jgi:hypothetical protein
LTLAETGRFVVPHQVIKDTERSLRRAGEEGYELFVLWSGVEDGAAFCIRSAHVPRQSSYRSKEGLLVRVEGDALHKLNVWLFQNGEQLGAQVHAHPGEAFHSDTDESFPIAAQLGSLSLVAADFCRHGLLDSSSAAYRLTGEGWTEVTDALPELVQVTR